MENGGKTVHQNGEAKTALPKRRKPNIVSLWFMCWVCPVLYRGNQRDVEETDLIRPPSKQYDSQRAGEILEKNWLIEFDNSIRENRKASLWKAIVKTYWLSYMPGALYAIIIAVARVLQPMMFAELLQYWTVESTMTEMEAGMYALIIVSLNIVAMLCQHHNNLFNMRFSMKVKVACSAILYRKLLRVNQTAIGDIAAGKLVNLLSNDVMRIDYGFMFLHHLWITPIQAGVVLWLVWDAAGYAPFVGFFGVLILIFPIQAVLTKYSAVIRRETAQRTDKRIKLMGEIINGIQVIKMYAWEKPFQKVVEATRAYEMVALTRSIFVRSVFLGFMMFTERTIVFVTCLVFILSGTMVTATVIYPIQQYFGIVQINLAMILPLAIASLTEMFVAFDRIRSFLELGERDDLKKIPNNYLQSNLKFQNKKHDDEIPSVNGPQKFSPINDLTKDTNLDKNITTASEPLSRPGSEFIAELSGVSASWTDSKEHSEMTLKDVSIRFRKGKLSAVIGPVGSGKSSLFQVLLKELPPCKGTFNVKGVISYASQDPWLFPATVRENILFGLPYDVDKYKQICAVCCLKPDFKQFPYGDLSLVGERGVSLSGGQRARISLARAVYRDADIYLLDDPLSAVDANVGRLLFEGCINGYLRGRTTILVTHQVHFLKDVEQIVILNEGSVENIGTYNELASGGKDFSLMLENLKETEDTEKTAEKRPSLKKSVSLLRSISVKSDEADDEKEQIQQAEERAVGSLKFDTLYQYLAAVRSWPIIFGTLTALIISQAAATMTDYWLSYWTNNVNVYMEENDGAVPDSSLDMVIGSLTNAQYLGIYGGLIASVIALLLTRITIFAITTSRASRNLHNSVFQNLLGAVMRFFDTNPSGRVLNRFSKDLGTMDELLPRSFIETIQMYLLMFSVLILNATALPWTLIPTAVLIIIFIMLLRWYLKAAQAVKRLEGTTKSPVFGKVNSTISGLVTIRCSNAQDRLIDSFDEAQDLHTSAFYTFIGGSSAFGMYLDLLCVVYLAVILSVFIFIDFGDMLPVGSVGLAVSQSLALTMILQMAARFTGDFLAQTTSIERVLEYTQLPKEKNMSDGPTKPPKNWPQKGDVKFERLFMKYGEDDPPVLKDLNIDIQNGWKLLWNTKKYKEWTSSISSHASRKSLTGLTHWSGLPRDLVHWTFGNVLGRAVGVVGRTGAGKSSLISALFRLYEVEGSIKIDSLDTLNISKQELRSRISIIPQEPVLFSATLRYNLDPFDMYSDDDIWRALEQVELKDVVTALDFKVSEGGSNFSVGQRQLLCLARAVLRSNKILVMDEATANVDPQTDVLIQKTIRRQFADCTVITIAHRLNTIMDSDRVLVMDKGQVAEFDYPYKLLTNPNSILSFMVKETGNKMSQSLHEIAKTKYMSMSQEQNQ